MDRPESEENGSLPEELQDALGRYSNRRVLVPPTVDEKVLDLTKQELRRRTERLGFQQRLWWAAAALVVTALVISSLVGMNERKQGTERAAISAGELGDFDRNGKVDIFDAFALARNLKQRTASAAWDVNGDGTVDERDVTALAQRAVQLPKGGVL